MNVKHINTVCIWYYAISCSYFSGQSSQMVYILNIYSCIRWLTGELEFLNCTVSASLQGHPILCLWSGWYLDIYGSNNISPTPMA